MTVSRIITIEEFNQMMSYNVYAKNQEQQQSMKRQLMAEAKAAYGERYDRLDERTKGAIDMLCWFATERGFVFAKDQYLAERYQVSSKTIRNILQTLRAKGVIFTVYRHKNGQNGRTSPVQLFKGHPYYAYWEKQLNLGHFQSHFQSEIAETPCESKDEQPKKVPTLYLTITKDLLKTLRRQGRLNSTFTPKNVPKEFVQTARPFFDDAKEIADLWQKAVLVYRQFDFLHELDEYTEVVVDALKQSVYALKHRKIRKDFKGYFYGTLLKMFTYQKRRETFASHPSIYNWLEEQDEKMIGSTPNEHTNWAASNPKEERTFDNWLEELPY